MAFTVVSDSSPQTMWYPVLAGATVYVGDLVCEEKALLASTNPSEGVQIRNQADGVNNITNNDRPLGIVIGHNQTAENTTFTAAAAAESITGTTAASINGSTTNFVGVEGPWGKSDKRAMVKVQLIGPQTLLRAPLKNDDPLVAPTLLTATAGGTDGDTVTTNATDGTPVAGMNTIYCRTGLNAGIYRTVYTTSKTVHVWLSEMPYDTSIGDTFLVVPVRPHGSSYVRFGDDTYCSYLNVSETPATNYDVIQVVRLDLEVAGGEYVDFYFDARCFSTT